MNARHSLLQREIIIEPGRNPINYLHDLWSYRELFYFLSWRDILVRYKQTIIGITWSIIRPLIAMLIFTIIFGKLAKLPSEGIAYPILVFAGVLPWQFFSASLSEGSNSLIDNANLISKIYFPRIIVPASAVIVSLLEFLISFSILILLMVCYRIIPTWRILTLPLFVLVAFLASFGAGLWFASLNVRYRDFRYIIPFIVQFGLYVSPVGFSSSIVPEKWRLLYAINPMVGVIDSFRWAILGSKITISWLGFMFSLLSVLLVLLSGIWYFRRTERTFADII